MKHSIQNSIQAGGKFKVAQESALSEEMWLDFEKQGEVSRQRQGRELGTA